MLIKTGSYTGDGTSSRNIDSGLGVQLRCVIIKGGANAAVIFISGMSASFALVGSSSSAGIAALNSGGTFTINNNANVNSSGTTYDWVAISDADGLGDFTFGSYVGDATTGRNISCSLNPVLAIVQEAGSVGGVWRSTAHTTTSCSFFSNTANAANRISVLGTGQFTVNNTAQTNSSGLTYFWIAFAASAKLAVGSYSGNGVDNRDISTALAAIIAAFVKADAATNAQFRNDAFSDDSSALVSTSAPASNAIQRFNPGGLLDVGTDSSVNASATPYYWFAFGKVLTFLFGEDDLELVKHRGATSQIAQVYIRNSNTGAGLSGLVYNTSGLTAYYSYNGDTASHAITLATMTLGTFTSGGFKEIDATNMPGVYQFCIPDAALANGGGVDIVLQGAATMLECRIKVQLIVSDLDDGTALGLSRIDAAISSRSTYAGADTAGTTTLLSRIAAAITITSGKVDVNDKTGFALTSGEHTNIASDAQSGLTSQGYTTTRAGYLDTLNGLAQAIWDKATSALTTVGSIGKLLVSNIDAAISSRLATSGYGTPPTASQNAAAVVDQTLSGHTTAGTVGAALNAAGSAGDPLINAVPGSYASGSAGWYLGQLGTIRDKTLLITADNVHFTTPTDPITGDLTLVRGDDYTVTSGRALPEWSSDDWTPFSLTTARSVTFKAKAHPGDVVFSTAAAVLSDTQVRVEVTAAQTSGFAVGRNAYRFDLEAALATGDVVTLAQGQITIMENVQ